MIDQWNRWAGLVVLVLATLTPGEVWAADNDSWIGKRALRKREGVKLHQIDKATNTPGSVVIVDQADVRVDHVRGDFVWARTAANEGWVAKDDLVRMDDAIAYFTNRVQQNPDDVFAYNMRAIAYNDRGEFDKALADYTEAIRISPQSSHLRHNRAVMWFNKKEYNKSLADSDEAIRLNPNNAIAYYQRGDTRLSLKDYDKALADFTEATRILPGYAAAHAGAGWALFFKKEFDRAVSQFSEAIRHDPVISSAYRGRARAFQGLKNLDKSLADFDEAIRLAPERGVLYNDRAWIWFEQRDYKKALQDFDRGVRLEPKDAQIWRNRGFIHYILKDYAKAREDCEKALSIDPRHLTTLNDLAWLLATCPDSKYRDGQKAVTLARRACELTNWNSPNPLSILAAAYAEVGNFEQAVKHQKQAIEQAASEKPNPRWSARLRLFEEKKPYRHEWRAASAESEKEPPTTLPAARLPAGRPEEMLQGTWVCVTTLKEGTPVSSYVGVKAVMQGDSLTWHFPQPDGTYLEQKAKFRLDSSEEPGHFDWWPVDKPESVDQRIYTIKNNELRWSTNLDRKTRPQTFEGGHWQFIMKRLESEPATGDRKGNRE